MKKIRFIGDYYHGYDPKTKRDVRIAKKGVVTISDEKAKQLLADMPGKFKELSWRPKKEEEKVEKLEEKKLEPLKDKKLEELKNK